MPVRCLNSPFTAELSSGYETSPVAASRVQPLSGCPKMKASLGAPIIFEDGPVVQVRETADARDGVLPIAFPTS